MTRSRRKPDAKKWWPRVPNIKEGGAVGNKYDFSLHLKKVGDFVETHPLPKEDAKKVTFAAYIWAYRHRCRVSCNYVYYPDGTAVRITVVSNTRKERN